MMWVVRSSCFCSGWATFWPGSWNLLFTQSSAAGHGILFYGSHPHGCHGDGLHSRAMQSRYKLRMCTALQHPAPPSSPTHALYSNVTSSASSSLCATSGLQFLAPHHANLWQTPALIILRTPIKGRDNDGSHLYHLQARMWALS